MSETIYPVLVGVVCPECRCSGELKAALPCVDKRGRRDVLQVVEFECGMQASCAKDWDAPKFGRECQRLIQAGRAALAQARGERL